jgi:hypothetical protein
MLVPLFSLYMDQSTEMLLLGLDTDQLLGTIQQLNQVCQIGLQLLKKGRELYKKYGSLNTSCDFFHPILLILTFCPDPRIPTKRFSVPTQVLWSTHCIVQVKSSPNSYKCNFLYVFFYLATCLFLLRIPSHILIQPLILLIFLAPMNHTSPSIFNCHHPVSHNTSNKPSNSQPLTNNEKINLSIYI